MFSRQSFLEITPENSLDYYTSAAKSVSRLIRSISDSGMRGMGSSCF